MSGRFKATELTGKRFGHLLVIRQEGRWISSTGKTDNITWLCKCDCGKEKHIRPSKLIDGSTISCGCWRKENNRKPRTPKGHAGKVNLYNDYRKRAKKLHIPFELTRDQFIEITSKKCHYCNADPANSIKPRDRMVEATLNAVYVYNGIDRKVPRYGYVISNSLPCCSSCNMAKSDMPYEDFIKHIERIYFNRVKAEREHILKAI